MKSGEASGKENAMEWSSNDRQVLNEIEALNLSALILSQNLLKTKREEALFRLGIDEATAQLIEGLSIRQLQKISKIPYFLFQMNFNQPIIWEVLKGEDETIDTRGLAHAMIIAGAKK